LFCFFHGDSIAGTNHMSAHSRCLIRRFLSSSPLRVCCIMSAYLPVFSSRSCSRVTLLSSSHHIQSAGGRARRSVLRADRGLLLLLSAARAGRGHGGGAAYQVLAPAGGTCTNVFQVTSRMCQTTKHQNTISAFRPNSNKAQFESNVSRTLFSCFVLALKNKSRETAFSAS
jgi:hypothetical protein